jgi:hypothetical protein
MKSRKNGPVAEEKSVVSSRQCTVSQINQNSGKIPPHYPDLAPSDFFLFADLKKMLAGKKFSTNQEVITET